MGVYDTVRFSCPICGKDFDLQSKAGDCELKLYRMYDAPQRVLTDLVGESHTCTQCSTPLTIRGETFIRIEYD